MGSVSAAFRFWGGRRGAQRSASGQGLHSPPPMGTCPPQDGNACSPGVLAQTEGAVAMCTAPLPQGRARGRAHLVDEVSDLIRVGGPGPVLGGRHQRGGHVVADHLRAGIQAAVQLAQVVVLRGDSAGSGQPAVTRGHPHPRHPPGPPRPHPPPRSRRRCPACRPPAAAAAPSPPSSSSQRAAAAAG